MTREFAVVDDGSDKIDQLANGSGASRKETARLKALFQKVDPIEITGSVDLRDKSPQAIAALLPKFTAIQEAGGHPAFGMLVDPKTGRAWSLRSRFSPQIEETVNGIRFKSGIMTQELAQAAGGAWSQALVPLGAHIEGQAAAFLRKMDITEAVLYINGGNPCKTLGIGCYILLPELLAQGSVLTVYNKRGQAFPPFIGLPD